MFMVRKDLHLLFLIGLSLVPIASPKSRITVSATSIARNIQADELETFLAMDALQ